MAIQAVLYITNPAVDREYVLVDYDYEFRQKTGENAQPKEAPTGGLINFTIMAPDDNDLTFHEWMINVDDQRDGEIIFTVNAEGIESTKTLIFRQATCTRLHEMFFRFSEQNMNTKITIHAQEMQFGPDDAANVVYQNDALNVNKK